MISDMITATDVTSRQVYFMEKWIVGSQSGHIYLKD